MRVLLINQFYSPDTAATGQLLRDLALGLIREGHEVHVMCSRRMYGGGGDLAVDEDLEGVCVHRVHATGFGRNVTIGRLVDWMSFYFLAMFKALRLPRMDIAVCLTTPPLIGVVGMALRWIRGTKLIIWSMDVYPEIAVVCGYLRRRGLIRCIAAVINRHLYRTASCVISLGDRMTEHLVQAGASPQRIATVHNWAPGMGFPQLAPAGRFEEANAGAAKDVSVHRDADEDAEPALRPAHRLRTVDLPLKRTGSDTRDLAYND